MTILRGKIEDFAPLLRDKTTKNAANSAKTQISTPRARKPKALLPENIVETQIVDFLRIHGWTVTRQQSALVRGAKSTFRVGTPGDLDWRAEKPCYPNAARPRPEIWSFQLEVKAPGKRPKPHQQARIDDLAARGFVAVWFDSFDAFRAWLQKTFGRTS